jgi:hypothetical protein
MKILSRFRKLLEDKAIDLFLAKILDRFKANSPKIYAIIMLIAITIHSIASSWVSNYEVHIAQNPDIPFEGVNIIVAQILHYVTLIIAALTGSRTSDILAKIKKF